MFFSIDYWTSMFVSISVFRQCLAWINIKRHQMRNRQLYGMLIYLPPIVAWLPWNSPTFNTANSYLSVFLYLYFRRVLCMLYDAGKFFHLRCVYKEDLPNYARIKTFLYVCLFYLFILILCACCIKKCKIKVA